MRLYFGKFEKILQEFLNFLTASSLLIACTGFFQTFGGFILLGSNPRLDSCIAVFLMTLSVYSLNKLTDIKEDSINRPERINFLAGREKLILGYSLAAFLVSAAIAYSIKPEALLVILIPLIANAAYSTKLLPNLPRLKDIPAVKNIVVGLSWALVCTLMPAIRIDDPTYTLILPVIYLMTIKDFTNSTLCDLKDINGDRINGVRTIPVVLGAQTTRRILLVLNCSILPCLILIKAKIMFFALLLVLCEYAFIFCFGENSRPYILEFFIDGEWLLACTLLLGFSAVHV
jgi:4-hydroxybenzoate polyprenyltransferase